MRAPVFTLPARLSCGLAFCLTLHTLATSAQYTSSSVSSATASAAQCRSTISPKNGQPSVAPGWSAQVVANALTKPRGMVMDAKGRLLVVQQGKGILGLETDGEGDCVGGEGADVLLHDELTHGIALSPDGKTLYASDPQAVYSWDYDDSLGKNTSSPRLLIGNMGDPADHNTRTLLLSRKVPELLLVSRGSTSNLDLTALNRSSGISTIKAFNLTNVTDTGYDYRSEGLLLGWGLRNSVGVGEEPVGGGIYAVENSVDNFERDGKNIHEDNPGEEMNYLGYLNGTLVEQQGKNFGYPECFAAWGVDEIPQNQNIQVGTQFAIGEQNATINDTFCQQDRIPPRLTFQAHMAPLDIKFNSNGTVAYVSFHGSWNRDAPVGYKLSAVAFSNGSPSESADSTTAAIDIVSNPDLSKCPDDCFRPAGLAWDSQGRLYMSSDSSGEIFAITRDQGSADEASPSSGLPSPASSSTGSAASPTKSSGAASSGLKDAYRMGLGKVLLALTLALPLI